MTEKMPQQPTSEKNGVEKQEREPQIITAMSPEGKLVKFDIGEEVKKANGFYKKYNLAKRGEGFKPISESFQLDSNQTKRLTEVIEKFGFDSLLIVPDHLSADELSNNKDFNKDNGILVSLKVTTSRNIRTSEGFTTLAGETETSEARNKNSYLREKQYSRTKVIAYKSKDHVDTEADHTADTRDKTFPEVLELEKNLGLEGLDLISALILNRQNFDKTGKRLFSVGKDSTSWLTKEDLVKNGFCMKLATFSDSDTVMAGLASDKFHEKDLGSIFCRYL